MRVRILKPSAGIIERVSLSSLLPGLTYELPASLGTFLVAKGSAVEVVPAPGIVIPLDNPDAFHQILGGVTVVQPRDRPDERPSGQPARKKK